MSKDMDPYSKGMIRMKAAAEQLKLKKGHYYRKWQKGIIAGAKKYGKGRS